ncbi:DUF4333 domain-containing protein [Nocardia cyriacigeorgica]|uniref:DUF4333 domain-containing protein n=1 Tax=Nocardia cyriacigeorgica TaxID=135487 RepID=A0A4U8W7N0_9NOCA|nr:DUF4333 domain-containing protein [Nocardia cyriacigeorgica]MBF6347147.1 DUF4333 domain-containing protein [Nocardia cyriacigeorgica]VFA98257.1 Uncharacterised protein [Nocardia cyriacigeorgica]
MSGPYGPNDAPGPGEGRNDPTQHWGGQQAPGGAGPTQQWGGQQPAAAQPTQQWGGGEQGSQQQWGQPNQPQQPGQPQWGQPQQPQQPSQPQSQPWAQPQQQPQQQWGQPQQQPQQQWGQPQQPQQDWGQQGQQQWNPNQPQQPLQQSGGSGGGKSKGLIIGLAVLGVAIVGGIVALILLLTAKDELDQAAVQSGVQKVLSESYGIEDVSDVSCPAGQEVKVDATFTCDLKVSGEAKKVSVKITKDDGTYEVGRPS